MVSRTLLFKFYSCEKSAKPRPCSHRYSLTTDHRSPITVHCVLLLRRLSAQAVESTIARRSSVLYPKDAPPAGDNADRVQTSNDPFPVRLTEKPAALH